MPIDREGRFFEGGKAIAVDGGIAVRAKRGKIGEQWWSRRFVDVLERVCDGGRLARGRAYARKGQVMDFHFVAGKVTARVQGSRPQPYRVEIELGAEPGGWQGADALVGWVAVCSGNAHEVANERQLYEEAEQAYPDDDQVHPACGFSMPMTPRVTV